MEFTGKHTLEDVENPGFSERKINDLQINGG